MQPGSRKFSASWMVAAQGHHQYGLGTLQHLQPGIPGVKCPGAGNQDPALHPLCETKKEMAICPCVM